MRIPLSILDLAPISRGETAGSSIAASVALAQRAEEAGYDRVWYAEHHNMPSIASSATSVLIAHVGAQTSTIRLGAGGVMLPNHAPLTIAEQFGTLDAMYPGRIDLGLGRAPGSDQNTMYALRRDPMSADKFPQDVLELQAYLAGETRVPGVDAVPGKGSRVPLYVLGSSMFGATLAAALGLPYAFASHFAPQMLEPAVAAYRREFRPSEQLDRPYVIAGVNALAADTDEQAQEQLRQSRRFRAIALFGRGQALTDEQADQLLAQGAAQHVDQMLTYAAVGTPAEVGEYLDGFAKTADADELIVAHQAPTTEGRLRSVALVAEAMGRDSQVAHSRSGDDARVELRSVGVDAIDEVVEEAVGRRHRPDPVLGRTAGPAGNAQLTAWTGLLLLALAVVEMVTLIDVRGLLSWHVVVGVLLAAVAPLKIASAGWRFLRYYGRNRPYRHAGPPPMLLRILGPFVVLGTVAVLASGLWLIAVGPDTGRRTLLTLLGQRIDLVSLHQASFVVFAVAAGLHLLARFVPAVVLATERGHRDDGRLRGRGPRIAVLVVAVVAGALAAALILPAAAPWQDERREPPPGFSQR